MDYMLHQIDRAFHAVGRIGRRKLALYFALYVLPLLLFVQLSDEVRERDTLPFDEAILRSIHGMVSPQLDWLVPVITDVGYVWWVGGMTLALLGYFLYKKHYEKAWIIAVGVAGSAVLNLILKALFQRDRPDLWARLVTENSYSFPSGHAMASASLAVAVMVVLWPTRWRIPAIVIGLLYMCIIAFTRLYLGVHYPTDILAGWLMAGSWVVITARVISHYYKR